MLYELDDSSNVKDLFCGWNDTLISAVLERVMGKLFVRDPRHPKSAMAIVGCFAFAQENATESCFFQNRKNF